MAGSKHQTLGLYVGLQIWPQWQDKRTLLTVPWFARYNLLAPNSLIRLMVQQSNCLQVVERVLVTQNMMQESQLAAGGNLQLGSNIGGGQMVTADFVMTPEVNFKENNAGGIGGAAAAFGGLFGGAGAVVGALAGGMKFKQAQTTLMLSDTRSGVQIATATGAAEKSDFDIGAVLGGGSVVYPKIAGVKVHKKADEGSAVVARLSKDSEALVSSTEVNGMVEVETADYKGWVSASKVRK